MDWEKLITVYGPLGAAWPALVYMFKQLRDVETARLKEKVDMLMQNQEVINQNSQSLRELRIAIEGRND